MNILLALIAPARGAGAQHLDISMSNNLFPLLYWALGQGAVTGRWPSNGTELVTGGTARYRLYPTGDGGMIAAAPIVDRFWAIFCDAIDLDHCLRDDMADPAATMAGVAARILAENTAFWREMFAAADCCCCPVASLQDAIANPHHIQRGLFSHQVISDHGRRMPALPVPLDPTFRDLPGDLSAPTLVSRPFLHQ